MLARSNPEIAGAVADEARKAAFRVPATHASPTTRLPAVAGHPISNRHPCRLETDDPSRIKRGRPGRPARGAWGIIPSDQREPRDLSPLPASRRRSNRHPCRLETTLNPCASMAAPFLIVTQSPLFCARVPGLPCPTGKHTGLVASDFSNRNIPLLEDPQVHENKG
jgi:hypothetical protein